jgi:hypothetical protein
MKRVFLLMIFIVGVGAAAAQTGTFSPTDLTNVTDGKNVTIKPCTTCTAVVVVFHSLKCPYDAHYAERVKKLVDSYGNQVSFFLVNSSPEPDEQAEKMVSAYSTWGINIPYLADKDQVVMSALNAKKTPEAVLLRKEGAQLKVVYQGAIDDNPQVHSDTGTKFLDNAIKDVLAGKNPTVAAERVIGCTIRKK